MIKKPLEAQMQAYTLSESEKNGFLKKLANLKSGDKLRAENIKDKRLKPENSLVPSKGKAFFEYEKK